jgi:hypothetical protein
MKKDFIFNYLSESYKDTGILSIYYDFSGASGLFVPNNLYPINNQFGKINSNYFINNEYSPGIFVSCYNQQVYTGSGIFQGQNNLKVLNNLSGNNITLFYNFGNISCDKKFTINSQEYQIPTGYVQVLSYLESKPNSSNPFEITLGLNDLNKLVLEFSGGKESYKSINFVELGFQNIASMRLNRNYIEYTYFDIIEDEVYNKTISFTGDYFDQEKNIYIGNLPTGKYRYGYTGYFGLVDGFTAYNQYIDESSCIELARLFLKTGDQFQQINITGITYNIIQSGFLNPTGVLGTGITGYQLIPSNEIINASCGDNCIVYLRSGITGIITGEKIEYKIISQQQLSNNQNTIKYNLYDQEYAGRFTKNNIVFNKKLDSNDIFEIQLYKDVETKIEIPNYANASDTYLTNDILDNRNLLIFFNGQNINSGHYQLLNNNTNFRIEQTSDNINDVVLYTISNFSDVDTYIFNNTGIDTSTNINILKPNINYIFRSAINNALSEIFDPRIFSPYADSILINNESIFTIGSNWTYADYTTIADNYEIANNSIINFSTSLTQIPVNVGAGAIIDSSEQIFRPIAPGKLNHNIYDVYLNGQKLVSGLNYIIYSNNTLSLDVKLPSGEVYVIKDNFSYKATGSNLKYYSPSGINYNNERIWVNGLYQNKNENYILASCFNKDLLTNQELETKNNGIFTGDYYRFNLV